MLCPMKKFAIALLIFVVTFTVTGLFLDKKWEVERSISVDANRVLVHSYVADLRTWPDWTAWSRDRDPECVWTYSGSDFGKGMTYSWEGEELGTGHMTITSASLEDGVEFDLVFGVTEGEGDLAQGKFVYGQDDEGNTTVTWTFFGEIEGTYGGWFALFMDILAGGEFEKGLVGLKETCEKGIGARLEEGAKELLKKL